MSIRPARLFLLWLAPLAAISLGSGLSAQGGHQNPRVVPPGASYQGQSYGEWSAEWWQAVFAIPADVPAHPLIVGGAFEEGGIVFLSAPVQPAGSPTVTLDVTIPPGTPLFLPIITAECSVFEPPPFHGDDEPSLRTCANDLIDLVSDVSVEIDGRPVNSVSAYRAESPLFRWGPVPANNVLGAPAGTTSDAVSDGYFLMLPPLSVGVHHVIVRAAVEDFGIEVDTEFIITVEPRGK